MGFKVFDADAAVHELYGEGGEAVVPIGRIWPDVIVSNSVNRPKLAEKVISNPSILSELESIVHPLVSKRRRSFYEKAGVERELLVVYDIPLLLENRDKHDVDYVLVATASSEVQRARVLGRIGMSVEKFEAILKKQMPDEEKRKLADFLINTDFPTKTCAKAQVARVVENLVQTHRENFQSWKSRPFSVLSISRETSVGVMKESAEAEFKLSDHFDLVAFDLDDTLVPTLEPVNRGLEALNNFVRENMPKSASAISCRLREEIKSIAASNPLIAHDLTELRMQAMQLIAKDFGEEYFVQEAMERFLAARSDIIPSLYADVMPCLDWIRNQGVKIALLTNGNADLDMCGSQEFRDRFCVVVRAGDVGAKKPSIVPFISVVQLAEVPPSRILFVGDSFSCDIVGSKTVGMCAALLVRNLSAPTIQGVLDSATGNGLVDSDNDVTEDIRLHSLDPKSFCEQLTLHFQSGTP